MRRTLVPALCSLALAGLPVAAPTAQAAETSAQVVRQAVVSTSADHPSLHPHGQHGRGHRGALLSVRPLRTAAALPSAAANYLVRYTSRDAHGEPIVVTGTVALPEQRRPAGGWPVISWAHGTTGTADVCAPSRDTAGGPAHSYLSAMDLTLDRWVAEGYVVVKTDYEGLGTPGPHPYINGTSEANTLVDIVRAARHLDRRVGRDWFAVGHSQGGQAALFASAQLGGPHDVRLRGAVALAPGGVFISQVAPFILTNQPGAQAAIAFLPTILVGAAAVDPAVDPEALLTDTAESLLDVAARACQQQINEAAASVPVDDVFEPGADLGPLSEYLVTQEPQYLTVRVPTLVLQGTADLLVSKPTTDFLVSELRKRSDDVQYLVYEGADHRGVVPASFADQLSFVESLLPRHRHGR
jgi:dienelactone hydrolase